MLPGNSHLPRAAKRRQPGASLLSTVPNCDHLNKTFSTSDFTSLHFSHPQWGPPRQLEWVASVPLAIVNSRAAAGLRSSTAAEGHFLSRMAGLFDTAKRWHVKTLTDYSSEDRILRKKEVGF